MELESHAALCASRSLGIRRGYLNSKGTEAPGALCHRRSESDRRRNRREWVVPEGPFRPRVFRLILVRRSNTWQSELRMQPEAAKPGKFCFDESLFLLKVRFPALT
jgi:hypothetical protein